MPSGYGTYVGVIIALLPSVLSVFHLSLVPGAPEQLASMLNDGITIAAGIYAFYRRAIATVPGFLVKNP